MSSGFWSFRRDERSDQDRIESVLEALPTVDTRTGTAAAAAAGVDYYSRGDIADSFEEESVDDAFLDREGGGDCAEARVQNLLTGGGCESLFTYVDRYEAGSAGASITDRTFPARESSEGFSALWAHVINGGLSSLEVGGLCSGPLAGFTDEPQPTPAVDLLMLQRHENSARHVSPRTKQDVSSEATVTSSNRRSSSLAPTGNVFQRLTPGLQKTRDELRGEVKIEALRRQREREAEKRLEAETARQLAEQVTVERERLRQARAAMQARSLNGAVARPAGPPMTCVERASCNVVSQSSPKLPSAVATRRSSSAAGNDKKNIMPCAASGRPPIGPTSTVYSRNEPSQTHSEPLAEETITSSLTPGQASKTKIDEAAALADRISARAKAREEARRLLNEQYEAKRRVETERELQAAEAEVAILLSERKKREARLQALRLKSEVRAAEKSEVEIKAAEKWASAVAHHERSVVKFYGFGPWKKVCQQRLATAQQLRHRHAFQLTARLWALWRQKAWIRQQVRFARSVARSISLARLLWHCFKRSLFLRWRDQIRLRRTLERRSRLHFTAQLLLRWRRRLEGRKHSREVARLFLEDANAKRFEMTHQRYELHAAFRWWASRWSRRVEAAQREQFRQKMGRRVLEILS